jgi:hypothetical protein
MCDKNPSPPSFAFHFLLKPRKIHTSKIKKFAELNFFAAYGTRSLSRWEEPVGAALMFAFSFNAVREREKKFYSSNFN